LTEAKGKPGRTLNGQDLRPREHDELEHNLCRGDDRGFSGQNVRTRNHREILDCAARLRQTLPDLAPTISPDASNQDAAVFPWQGMDESVVREARLKPRQGGAKARQGGMTTAT